MQGVYEHFRDNFTYPTCWRAQNDACPPHFHGSLEIVYVTDGELKATLNGKSYTVKKNQVVIASSYTVHFYSTENESESIVLVVPLDFIPSFSKILSKKCFSQCIYTVEEADSELLHCMKILAKDRSVCDSAIGIGSNEVVKGYIYVILGMLIDAVGLTDIGDDQNQSLIKDVLVYLQNNYLDELSLESLAKHFGYSKSRFSHIFNACFGCSIPEYISSLRCRHAASLLSNSVPLIDAAMSSSFDSMRTFYRVFKHCFGVTPTAYCNASGKETPG